VATRWISTFAPCWIWCQIHFLLENLWNYMKTWLKYVLCDDHYMSFVHQLVEFGVKFKFLSFFFLQLHEKMVEICPKPIKYVLMRFELYSPNETYWQLIYPCNHIICYQVGSMAKSIIISLEEPWLS
jgi:hypothetical protein